MNEIEGLKKQITNLNGKFENEKKTKERLKSKLIELRLVFYQNPTIWFADQSESTEQNENQKSENETKLNNQILKIQDELDKTKIEKNNAEDNIIKLTRQNQNEMLSGQLLSKIFQEIFMVFLNSNFLFDYFAFFSLHDFQLL